MLEHFSSSQFLFYVTNRPKPKDMKFWPRASEPLTEEQEQYYMNYQFKAKTNQLIDSAPADPAAPPTKLLTQTGGTIKHLLIINMLLIIIIQLYSC